MTRWFRDMQIYYVDPMGPICEVGPMGASRLQERKMVEKDAMSENSVRGANRSVRILW